MTQDNLLDIFLRKETQNFHQREILNKICFSYSMHVLVVFSRQVKVDAINTKCKRKYKKLLEVWW